MNRILLFLLAVSLFASLAVAQAPKPDKAAASDGPKKVSSAYRLTPSDLLIIKVFEEPEFDRELRLAKDGTISYPLIGTVDLGGRTVEEATAHIQELLKKDYLVNPQVSITIKEYSKRWFSVLGQVLKPDRFEIPPEEKVFLLEAIARAGGYTRIADPSKVTVTRINGDQKTVIRLNAKELARNKNATPFEILPGDTVSVGESLF